MIIHFSKACSALNTLASSYTRVPTARSNTHDRDRPFARPRCIISPSFLCPSRSYASASRVYRCIPTRLFEGLFTNHLTGVLRCNAIIVFHCIYVINSLNMKLHVYSWCMIIIKKGCYMGRQNFHVPQILLVQNTLFLQDTLCMSPKTNCTS